MAYRLGFDVGGTFTDFALQSPSGELLTGKRLTTYPDPSEACLAGLDELIAKRGVGDVLVIGREKRYQVYDLQIEKPAPLIPRRFIGEVTERILADGLVRTPLDEADARR